MVVIDNTVMITKYESLADEGSCCPGIGNRNPFLRKPPFRRWKPLS